MTYEEKLTWLQKEMESNKDDDVAVPVIQIMMDLVRDVERWNVYLRDKAWAAEMKVKYLYPEEYKGMKENMAKELISQKDSDGE